MDLQRLPQEASVPPASPVFLRPPAWYDLGVTKVAKITVSLPQQQVEQVRGVVARGEAASVSGFVSAALAEALAKPGPEQGESSLAELVAELIAEYGEPSAEAYAWADAALALSDPH
jgi:Arc/MetJ-type ribon-helix-helix transcriptional regulator